MTDIRHPQQAPAQNEPELPGTGTDDSATGTLIRAMDLIHGSDTLETGITAALSLCQAATGADMWVLVRRANGVVTGLAAGPQHSGSLEWLDAVDSLAQPWHLGHLLDTPWCESLPQVLRAHSSLISVPLDMTGEPPMAMLLLSRQPAGFTGCDHELFRGLGRAVQLARRGQRAEHKDSVPAEMLDTRLAEHLGPRAFLNTSFESLSQAYAQLAEWQHAIVGITNELLSSSTTESNMAINRALARTGALAGSDRTYVFRLRDPDRIDNTHEWAAAGIEPMITHLQDMPASLMDEWRPDMVAGRAVHIPDVAALPGNSTVREVLMMQAIRSLLAVPMLRDDKIVGFVGFDAVRAYRRFLPQEIQLLQAVANAVNIVLDRCAAERAAATAHAALEAERNRLQQTLTAIPDLVLELDHEGRFSAHVAGAALRPVVSSDRLLGRMPEDVLPADLAALARRVMRTVDRDGTVSGEEYELSIEGEPHWFSVSAAAKCAQGRPCGYVFVIRDITTQLCQRRRLQRMGKIAELTSNLVIVTDADQRIEWVNPAFERRTGWRLEEITGMRPDSFLASESTDRAEMHRIGAALRNGEAVRAELLNQTRNGETYWISKDIQPLFGSSGQVEGYVAVQTDITEMKRSHRAALRDRAVALDASGDGIAITDVTGHYIYMNAAHRRMFGIDDDEDIHRLTWRDLLPPNTVSNFMAEHWDSFAAAGTWRGELEGLHRDGSPVEQEVSLTLRETGILCIARDISKRRQMERALRDRAVALDASDDGIAITDSSGHYTYMNAAHRRMFGIRDDEDISALHWHALYPDETIRCFMAREWEKLQADGRWRGELHGLHRDGSPVPQEVSLTLHDDGILCMTRGIAQQLQIAAERARLREELQRAQRKETIAHIASGVAHDLNNLVAVVAGSISLLEKSVTQGEDTAASVARVKRAAEAARDLVDGLKHLGQPRVEHATHDLRDLITEGIELLGTSRIRDNQITTALPETPCPVWADGTALLQVILNLALNACEASTELPNRVSIGISADAICPDRAPDAGMMRRGAHYQVFTISDSGTGIDAATREKLFDRYFTTKGDEGTGLGLPIVAGLLRENGGALWIDSMSGMGTTVTVAWPVDAPATTTTLPGAPMQGYGHVDLKGRNILVVDDLQDVGDVLSEFLEASGANAVALSDPAEARTLMQDDPSIWAALVTDLDMPVVNGSALARIAADCDPAIPVILVTALPETVGPERHLFSDILSKPVQPEQLVTAVHTAIEQATRLRPGIS